MSAGLVLAGLVLAGAGAAGAAASRESWPGRRAGLCLSLGCLALSVAGVCLSVMAVLGLS
jgi:hypothetical protein